MPFAGTGGMPAAIAGGGAIIGVPPSAEASGPAPGAGVVQVGGTDSAPMTGELPRPAATVFPRPLTALAGASIASPAALPAASPSALPAPDPARPRKGA